MSEAAPLDGKSFAMRGPMKIVDPRHTPVRGDLADIRLAGRFFVPHYAVPMPRQVRAPGAILKAGARADSEELAALAGASSFSVLDVAGDWAWGQAGGEQGPVGYVLLAALA